MITVNSISGGQTSAYMMAHYPANYNFFALVTTDDKTVMHPDHGIRKIVSERIGKEFIGTLEDDVIIRTMLELEQFTGQKITWVAGESYDNVVKNRGGWLPNKLHRYCTTYLKLQPMFYWWAEHIGEPVEMRLGFRANEVNRKNKTLERVNKNGLSEFKATFEKNKRGQNKWEMVEWQKPVFPLIDDVPTYKDQIVEYWKNKPVQFAELNNCVGCFHRNPLLLRKMYDKHPKKMDWFERQEAIKRGKDKRATWRSDVTYEQIKNFNPQFQLEFNDFDNNCDNGYCGL